jgi:hypothetical protein
MDHPLQGLLVHWPPPTSASTGSMSPSRPSWHTSSKIKHLLLANPDGSFAFLDFFPSPSMLLQAADLPTMLASGEQQLAALKTEQQQQNTAARQSSSSASRVQNGSFKAQLRREQEEGLEVATRGVALDRVGQGAATLDVLKEQAVQRGAEAAALSRAAEAAHRRGARLSLLAAMPRLCDSLRSLALTRNLTCFPMAALLATLSEQAALGAQHGSPRHLLCGLHTLAGLAPEFIQVFPPDDVLGYESARVNLLAPYGAVRAKVKGAADAAVREKHQLAQAADK